MRQSAPVREFASQSVDIRPKTMRMNDCKAGWQRAAPKFMASPKRTPSRMLASCNPHTRIKCYSLAITLTTNTENLNLIARVH
ncbi:MAG: hypothetical protein A2X49_09245 [Lentisphaerae bacterium GWF2_52_8]|nr:MAG: hypothetical protein A2X49_09245 [Lentisphaerae bacterium GWF2_52_8]